MRVGVLGVGRMGAQIALEYALGGHEVHVVARRPDEGRVRLDAAVAVARRHALAADDALDAARARMDVGWVGGLAHDTALVVESIAEDLDAKAELLGAVARQLPDATLATNTSSLSITAVGEAIGAPERTIGTHYWNPPLLMPLVEVIRGPQLRDERFAAVLTLLRDIGKRPVVVERDVPGFVWNRLQFALLREAVWLADEGVADPATIDEIVRDGLARRWRMTGPFETAALGGAQTFAAVAANLLPELSAADSAPGLEGWADGASARLDGLAERRDTELAAELRRDRERGA
jgi:3-hydroxybutyryl-CoA dehydrogenase